MDNCGLQFALKYRLPSERRPMWGGVGGTAYHAVIREFEENAFEMNPTCASSDEAEWDTRATTYANGFRAALAESIVDVVQSSTVPMSEWYASDRGRENREWWIEQGPQMVYKYVMAQRNRGYRVLAMSDGSPALEVHATDRAGGVEWQGYIDRIVYYPDTGVIVVEDDKSGARWPQDHAQIDMYGWWVKRKLAPSLPWAKEIWVRYWDARKGEHILQSRVGTRATWEGLAYRYATMDRADRAGIYPARPSSLCKACPVRSSCPEVGQGSPDIFNLLLTSQSSAGSVGDSTEATTEGSHGMTDEQNRQDFQYPADTEEGRNERRAAEQAETPAPVESEGVDQGTSERESDGDTKGFPSQF